MRRVASLYLPFLPTDRIRRMEENGGARPSPSPPPPPLPLAPPPGEQEQGGIYLGTECSCPRDGHWRPGARWAENSKERRLRTEAEIARLPLHQRPAMRELGRRSEAADMPFKGMKPDEGGAFPGEGRGPAAQASRTRGSAFAGEQAGAGEGLVVTVARSGSKITLAAVCRNALALGLTPGMALTQARAMVPGLEVRDADPSGDLALLKRIATFAARRLTPLVAVSGSDGLWLDLTGVAHLHGGERQLCVDLLRYCSKLGLGARIAVAGNGAAAHALARHGAERLLLCPEGGEQAALAQLPLTALRLEQAVVDALRRLGLERIGDLAAMPRAPLARRFGKETLLKLDRALGRAAEPFDPVVPRDAPRAELRFAEPIGGAETIAAAIETLLDQLIERLREAGLGARTLLLLCDRVDRQQQRIEAGAARATRDKAHWLRLLGRHIESIDPGFGIDAMRLVAVQTEPLGGAPLPSDLAAPEPTPDLSQLVDLIASRIGTQHLYRLSAVESDVPERSVRKVAPLDTPESWPAAWPRPPRLLPRPEPIANVMAEMPDAPPKRFTWRGKTHRLVRGDGPERITGEWWKHGRERDAVRDYFRVEDESGARFWLFRKGDGVDPRTGDLSWWIQGGCG
ncbi:DNA polymerase Y family protein [Sphingomonas sp. ID1715]|uniref:Y-family DNA polymerase n=1 Tax=Sphingomonas sp. ID1715 TaxID=1656898 RepID=UPI001487F068|nr:DNA polymerase Y family protein [Sphingomonas sp. ID1715]NNM78291.1 DNA polymerase Y family protein [Sphingomonas sp. ID1715]